jgi:hypothetical protein
MNKDTEIAKIEVALNKLGIEQIRPVQISNKVFSWIKDFQTFIIKRRAPKRREHIAELLRLYQCNSISGYLDFTHALSLNDTIWVKRCDDTKLNWNKVSLYRNKFSSVIARTAFDGGMYGDTMTTTSPEFSTNGTFAKCWIRENNKIKLLKKGTSGFSNAGLEPYSEYYSSQILKALNINHVDYSLTSRSGVICSKCKLFTSEDFGFVPCSAFKSYFNNITEMIDFFIQSGYKEFISEMFVVDAIILNEDRHLGNFGFMFDNNTGEIVSPAPLFDHNVSLLCYATQSDFQNIGNYLIGRGHKLDESQGDFITIAKALMTPKLKQKLNNMYGFKFTKHIRHNLPNWRLTMLSKVVNRQIELLLK